MHSWQNLLKGMLSMNMFIGVDIGGTNTRVGVVNRHMELLDFVVGPSQEIFKRGKENRLARMISDTMKHNQISNPEAIIIGLPSIVSKDGNSAVSTPNIRHLDGVDIATPLRQEFSTHVLISKDANLLLMYEMWKQDIAPDKTVVGVYLGTGIGNAVWVNGVMMTGRNNAACELGHIPVWNNSLHCVCGNTGCMETVVCGRYLEEVARTHFPSTNIHELFAQQWPHPVLEDFVDRLSIPIATEINIFDPDYMILGGGIVTMPSFPKEQLHTRIKEKVRPFTKEPANIVYSQGAQEAGVLGAAIYGIKTMKKEGQA